MDRRRFLTDLGALSLASVFHRTLLPARMQDTARAASAGTLSASMWIYLWDIVDEGYTEVLQRLKDHSLTSLSLATSYHAGKFLAPHNPRQKVIFPEDGTVYFSPRMHLYGRVKPLVNSLVAAGHTLARVKSRADDLGMETRAWVVCCHNMPLGLAYPDVTMRNAFGDPLPHNLCPSNPDVRAYLRTLLRDIASEGPSIIELEALRFQGYPHEYHHEREGIALTPAAQFLLGLCFCHACARQSSSEGIDLTPVSNYTRETLTRYFASPESSAENLATMDQLPADLFQPFHAWRRKVVLSLAEELVHAVHPLRTALRPMVSLDPVAQMMTGMDPVGVAEITGGVLAIGYVLDGAALRGPLSRLQSQLPDKEITVGFLVGFPESGGKTEFLDRMNTARTLGITRFNFYNYGFIPLERLPWIKDSLQG